MVNDVFSHVEEAYSEFHEWSEFCLLQPLQRLLMECGIVLTCDSDSAKTQFCFDVSGGSLIGQFHRAKDRTEQDTRTEEEVDNLKSVILSSRKGSTIQRIDCNQNLL